MEFAGEPDRNPRLAGRARGFFFADVTFQLGAELRTPARDYETDDFTLERTPDLEYLLGFIQGRLRCGCRAPWRRVGQAFGLQLGQSGAHQRATHDEAGAEFVFGKFGAGRQRLLDDRLAQYLAGQIDTGRFFAHTTPDAASGVGRIAHTVVQDFVHKMRQFWSIRPNLRQHVAQTLRFERPLFKAIIRHPRDGDTYSALSVVLPEGRSISRLRDLADNSCIQELS